MDTLVQSVKNFSEQEFLKFIKSLKGQPKKKELLKAIYHSEEEKPDFDTIAKSIGYKTSQRAFFTLKHRLIKDIINYRLHQPANEIVKTENRIHELRILLYSKDHRLLEREIRELKKKTIEYEIIRGRYEILFCEYLIHYHDSARRKHTQDQMVKALEQEKTFNLSELEFYKVIFEFQDIYFLSRLLLPDLVAQESLKKLQTYHEQLKTKVTEFFYLSAYLTFELRLGRNKEALNQLNDKIMRLQEIYHNKNFKQRFPNCDFAIKCLLNKYYLASGDYDKFKESVLKLKNEAHKIVGYKPYEDVLFYFLYAYLYEMFQNKRVDKYLEEINDLVGRMIDKQFSERFQYYYNHLVGFAYYILGVYRKAESHFLRSRNFEKFLEPINLWIQIENHLLFLNIQIRNRSNELANFELLQLKKLAAKNPQIQDLIKPFVKFTEKHIKSPIRVYFDYQEQFKQLCKHMGLLHLYDL